jgi:DNA-binding beta-propeller fold protein YncE
MSLLIKAMALGGLLAAGTAAVFVGWSSAPMRPTALATQEDAVANRENAPELEGGTAWLNTAGPLKLADLKGKIVILDFWTFCCINCIHTLQDVAKLEKKYDKELVVIGVHSAKFDNEKDTYAIRKAILRYQIAHPVVNDSEMKIWNRYGVNSWPTLVVIDPEGNYIGTTQGEGNYELLDQVIAKQIAIHEKKGTLDRKPLRFDLAKFREKGDAPLFFPGKVLADAASDRLFISDSTHHRLVITTLAGKKVAVIGTGEPGFKDGFSEIAQFDDPQGLALDGETLYVADRKNHAIRAVNLKDNSVTTIAGTGRQNREGRGRGGEALKTGLNSPWDLYLIGKTMYIAMAGHHQIWTLDLAANRIEPFAGNGRESILDGKLRNAELAQPSGLASDGKKLYVADSESSSVRAVDLDPAGEVVTVVGRPNGNLFSFGDEDGIGNAVRLQHALGVAYHDGVLYVADTYNSKIKTIDPAKRECKSWYGGKDGEGWLTDRPLNEPGGLSIANGKLYVADTNAHRIRVIDLKTKEASTLTLSGVTAPASVSQGAAK